MASTPQPNYNLVFELDQVKTRVNDLAARLGQDIKYLNENSDLGTYTLTGLNVNLTGSVVASDTVVRAVGKLQRQANLSVKITTLSNSANANSVSGSGIFTITAPTTANNFPTTEAGSLTQVVIGSSKTQQYLTNSGLLYVRGYNGSTWSAWRSI